jgi:hypothetical protein
LQAIPESLPAKQNTHWRRPHVSQRKITNITGKSVNAAPNFHATAASGQYQCARYRVCEIVMTARRMVNRVPATARHPPLKRAKLRNKPRIVE